MGGNTQTTKTASAEEVKFKKKVSKMKNSFTNRIVTKMDGTALNAQQREKPQEAVPGTRKRDKAKAVIKKVGHYGDKGMDITNDVGGGALDSLGSLMDYADGGSERTWGMVGDKGAKDKWGDMALQSEGVPIVGATIKAIKLLIDGGKYIKEMIDFAKDNKKETDGHTGTTTAEKWDVLKKTLELFMSCVDTANSIMGTFTTFLGSLPIVGAVLGTISNCIGFGANVATLIKSGTSISRMRKQKAKAKGAVIRNTASDTGFVKQEAHKELFSRKTVTKNKIASEFEDVKDEGASTRRGKDVMRKMRLDEKTKRMRSTGFGDAQLLTDLEDYDVTKELTSANKKRARQGALDLIFKDAVGIATSLATLDPTGLGAGVGAAISTSVAAGYVAKAAVVKGRQMARNSGRFGADVNKSDANKKQRRHNLAVIMYDRLLNLKKTPLIEDFNHTDAVANVEKYKTMDERISALGVAGPLFRAAGDPNEMLTVMRKGFYREND